MGLAGEAVKTVFGIRRLDPSRSVFDKHQVRIAQDTLRMSDAGARIMGGMTKDEARDVLARAGWSDDRIRKLEARKKQAKVDPNELELGVYIEYTVDYTKEEKRTWDYPGHPASVDVYIESAEMDWVGDLKQYPKLIEALEEAIAEQEAQNAPSREDFAPEWEPDI